LAGGAILKSANAIFTGIEITGQGSWGQPEKSAVADFY
jgi:hypothetical protein